MNVRLTDEVIAAANGYEMETREQKPPERKQERQLTDLGNAELLVDMHGDRLRYVRERRTWLFWSEGRWRPDTTGEAERAGKEVARELLRQAADVLVPSERKRAAEWAITSQSEPRIRAMLALAATEPGIALAADALDRDPWLLTCTNGTLDLRTGELRPHDPTDLLTLGTPLDYDPSAACPRWQRFLLEVFAGDRELVSFVQRAIGYSLTGDTREHVLFVLHGAGGNGKSTLIETIKQVGGDTALTAPFDSFTRSRGDRGPRNDLARLHRARLVVASESGEGKRLDEATVKQLTGADTVTTRFLYAEHFEYRPQFKLWLVTNHRPRVDGNDDAIWRRLRLIPFTVSFEGREDKSLPAALADELPGVLAWAVRGCLAWQQEGLGHAEKVASATASYRAEEDVVGAFLDERCLRTGSTPAAELREAYEAFCRELGERPLAAVSLGKRLARLGIEKKKQSGDRVYIGVKLA